jgi:ribose transport system permease protein
MEDPADLGVPPRRSDVIDDADATTSSDVAQPVAPSSRLQRANLGRFGVLGAFLLTFATFAVLRSDTFLTVENLKNVVTQSSALAIIAFGLTVVLSMRDFDLSVAAMASLGGNLAVYLMAVEGVDWRLAILIALCAGAAGGAVNGWLVAYVGASSFVITLALGTVFAGIEYQITGQETIFDNVAAGFVNLGQKEVLGLNLQVFTALGTFVVAYLLLEQTESGRYMRAVGGNPEAARLSGVKVAKLRLAGFMFCGVTAVLAGLVLTAQAGSASPNIGTGYLLPAFAAAFLGSAAFRVGEFNCVGTILGVLFLGVIQNGLTLMDASTAVINIVQGAILVFAVTLPRLGARRA